PRRNRTTRTYFGGRHGHGNPSPRKARSFLVRGLLGVPPTSLHPSTTSPAERRRTALVRTRSHIRILRSPDRVGSSLAEPSRRQPGRRAHTSPARSGRGCRTDHPGKPHPQRDRRSAHVRFNTSEDCLQILDGRTPNKRLTTERSSPVHHSRHP